MLPSKFHVNWPFSKGKNRKIDFKGGRQGFRIGINLAVFDVQITLILPTKFQVNWPFGSEEEAKNRFSIWPPLQPFWISDRNDLIYKSPRCFIASYKPTGLLVQEKKRRINFQDGRHK